MRRARSLPAFLVTVLAVASLVGCAVNPVTGRSELQLMSEKEEIDIGRKNYIPGQQQSNGQYRLDPELTAYIQGIGQKLGKLSDRPQLPYEFVVLNDSVPNAWAMPGGKIAFNRGLLIELKNEAELAAVMSHEIVHAAGRHAARGMESNLIVGLGATVLSAALSDRRNAQLVDLVAGVGVGAYGAKYGRDLELEADHYGIKYMLRAGYDPQAAVTLQETFVRLSKNKQPGWLEGLFASHPPSQERVEANRQLALASPGKYFLGEAEYQAKIAGLLRTREAYKQFDEGEKVLSKEPEKAIGLANAAIKIEPREALFYGLRGDAQAKLGRHAEAEADYNEAIKRNPDFYEFYLGRGKERRRRGDVEAAMADFAKANTLLPTAQAHYALGQMRLDRNEKAQAVAHFEAASGAESEDGKRAGFALAKLTLPSNPERFLSTEIERRGSQLILVVSNKSSVRAVDVNAEVMNSARGRLSLRVGSIAANSRQQVLLPFTVNDVPQGARLTSRVTSASVAE